MSTVNNLPPSEFLSESQLLSRIPICRRTLISHRQNNRIPFIKLNKRILYHWPSVQSALLKLQHNPTTT